MLRKGRFDEIFFVDLPSEEERREIFAIHIRKRGRDPKGFDLDYLARISDGYSGAEIEQAVVSAIYAASAQKQTADARHLLRELRATRPLSVVMAERVIALRAWATERA